MYSFSLFVKSLMVILFVLMLGGCVKKDEYTAKCTVHKVDGITRSVKITLPVRNSETGKVEIVVSSRSEAENVILTLESVISDLKMARDQFKNVEPSAN